MLNVLSYVGMNMQSEVCLWTLLGLLRTIFDATLFKVNANLKQVWQMGMPVEISLPVQRVLRTMISGVMLVQCFTVYIYLATYIVLLYPAFLEERPTLVLPWLLLAAIRKLLCELLSLALGLGTCVLVGAARPPCVKFVVVKIVTIMPSVYMWMLVLNYYHALKVASVLPPFSTPVPTDDLDYGLELAVRRRRTKSLLGEAQLRRRLLSHWYEERPQDQALPAASFTSPMSDVDLPHSSPSDSNTGDGEKKNDTANISEYCRIASVTGTYEDWFGHEITVPRNTDRISEQFVLMLLRIGAYLRKTTSNDVKMFESHQISSSPSTVINLESCPALTNQTDETPHLVGSSKENTRTASYLRLYPQIFMKGNSEYQSLRESVRTVKSSIIEKLEATERQLASTASRRNTILLEEKGTNCTATPSIENIVKTIDEEYRSHNNATQEPQSSNEINANINNKVDIIESHESIVCKNDASIHSDSSLNALIAKTELQLAQIKSSKPNTSTRESSSQVPDTPSGKIERPDPTGKDK